MAENTAPENPNPPASIPPEGEEKLTIANEEEYEKAIAAASRSENPELYKSKVNAAYQETLNKEAVKTREETDAELKKEAEERDKDDAKYIRSPRGEKTNLTPESAAALTGSDMGIGPSTGVGPSGPKVSGTKTTGK
jgi:hypothetical protein